MRLDLSAYDLDPEVLVGAFRRSAEARGAESAQIYEHVGHVRPSMDLDRRAAMAATARSRGETTTVDEDLRRVREELCESEPPSPDVDLEAARRRVAETAADIERLREQVATHRGRLQAYREHGDSEGAAAEYREAIRRLSEVETEHAAAVERLEEARKRARRARTERERRLRLSDRLDNLERTAREELIAAVESPIERAVAAAPGDADGIDEADDVTVALAVARVAPIDVPVVLSCRRFATVDAAGEYLRTPVIEV